MLPTLFWFTESGEDLASTGDVVSSHVETVQETVEHTVTEVSHFWSSIVNWLSGNWPRFVFFGIILVGGWLFATFIIHIMKHTLKRTSVEPGLVSFLCSISKYFLRFLVIILSLYPFGVQLTTVVAALGAAGLGLGLGLKEAVSNLVSGIEVVTTKMVTVGDYVVVNNVEGTVQKVEILFTTLHTLENHKVIIPNSMLTANTVTNYTALGLRRASFDFSLRYGTNLGKVREEMMQMVADHPQVLKEPEPRFIINGQGADGILCSLRVYTVPEDYWQVFWEINEWISMAGATDPNVDIPISQMEVYVTHRDPERQEKITLK